MTRYEWFDAQGRKDLARALSVEVAGEQHDECDEIAIEVDHCNECLAAFAADDEPNIALRLFWVNVRNHYMRKIEALRGFA